MSAPFAESQERTALLSVGNAEDSSIRVQSRHIHMLYFSDPLCSACRVADPYLAALLTQYQGLVKLDIKLGGMVKAWDELPPMRPDCGNGESVACIWDEMSSAHGVHMDSAIWRRRPVQSSHPASIAYHAAILQDPKNGMRFLQTIRDLLFLEGKDISEERFLVTAAIRSGLEVPRFLKALQDGTASEAFARDLQEAKAWSVRRFPTFVFINDQGESIVDASFLHGTSADQVLEHWAGIIRQLTKLDAPDVRPSNDVFALLEENPGLSSSEIAVRCGLPLARAESRLTKLWAQGRVIREQHQNAVHWRCNSTPYRIRRDRTPIRTAAVIGGGIAGYAAARSLSQQGVEVRVFDRQPRFASNGFGFLLLKNGIDALDALGLRSALLRLANPINRFRAVLPSGATVYECQLEDCLSMRREDLVRVLRDSSGAAEIRHEAAFEDFMHGPEASIIGARFTDGSRVEADLLVASDGIRSAVRQALFPQHRLMPVGEREVVGMAYLPDAEIPQDQFVKVIDAAGGRSMGMIPLGDGHYIWFLQFNHTTDPLNDASAESLRAFVTDSVRHYPTLFQRVVAANDFGSSFLWISERMDLLPAFSFGPVALLGDAAHPLLAFTSQGANSALEDAACLSSLVSRRTDERPIPEVLQRYYVEREPLIRRYITDGDQLVEQFMNLKRDKNFQLPLSLH
jgi:salicylate hydroxylase